MRRLGIVLIALAAYCMLGVCRKAPHQDGTQE